jgi:hypothetical protein
VVKVIRQSKSERKQIFAAKVFSALQFLAVPSWVKLIEGNLGPEFGGPSFESLGTTVEKGSREGQITWEQGLQATVVHHGRTMYFRI